MATVRLSICENTFSGDDLSAFGSLTGSLVQPTAPVLLTSNGPLNTLYGIARSRRYPGFAPIRSLGVVQGHYGPESANHDL